MTSKAIARRYARWDEAFEQFVDVRQKEIRSVERFIAEYNICRELLDDPEYQDMTISLRLDRSCVFLNFDIKTVADYNYAKDYLKRLANSLHVRKLRTSLNLPHYSPSSYGYFGTYSFRTNLSSKKGPGEIRVDYNFPSLGIEGIVEFIAVERSVVATHLEHRYLVDLPDPVPVLEF